jgi:hypothetical protein
MPQLAIASERFLALSIKETRDPDDAHKSTPPCLSLPEAPALPDTKVTL